MRIWVVGAAMAAVAGCGGPNPDHGATVYTANCATCHLADGSGEGAILGVANLNERVPLMTDAEIEFNVLNGGEEMDPVPLPDDDLADLLAYLRETFGGGE